MALTEIKRELNTLRRLLSQARQWALGETIFTPLAEVSGGTNGN